MPGGKSIEWLKNKYIKESKTRRRCWNANIWEKKKTEPFYLSYVSATTQLALYAQIINSIANILI